MLPDRDGFWGCKCEDGSEFIHHIKEFDGVFHAIDNGLGEIGIPCSRIRGEWTPLKCVYEGPTVYV